MSPSVSVAVMAHPRREAFIPSLLDALDRPAEVVWDQRNDRWDTGRRSMLAYDPAATHHLVVQDDAIVCRDLVAGLEAALVHVPDRTPVCLYTGRLTPFAEQTTEVARRATDQGAAWLVMEGLHWGVGIVMPTELIDPMIRWGDTRGKHIANYDKRISRWLGEQRISTWYPWPSLVDHRDSPSMVPGRGSRGRHAHRFLGADQSALDVDWSAGVVNVQLLRRFGTGRAKTNASKETPNVTRAKLHPTTDGELMTPRRTVTIHHERRRHRLKVGETVAHRDSWIVRHKPDLWKPLVVHYPAAPAPGGPGPEGAPSAATEPPDADPDGTKPEPPDVDADPPVTDPPAAPKPTAKAVRAWAKDEGIEVPARGPIPDDIVDRYQAAHPATDW